MLPRKKHSVALSPKRADWVGRNVKVREVIQTIQRDGWFLVRTRGDHRQFHHAAKPGTVTISGNLGAEMPKGTLNSVLKQAGLK